MDLKTKTHAELATLETSIRKERERRDSEEADANAKECASLVGVLLDCVVEHSRTSCSDENRANAFTRDGVPRCARCFLLDCRDQEYVPPLSVFRIDVRIRVREA